MSNYIKVDGEVDWDKSQILIYDDVVLEYSGTQEGDHFSAKVIKHDTLSKGYEGGSWVKKLFSKAKFVGAKTSILLEANAIINERSEEKERMYGPFSEGMEKASKLMSIMTGKGITARDMYFAMVALKLSRESYNHKEDNLLDAVAYLGGLHNYELESK